MPRMDHIGTHCTTVKSQGNMTIVTYHDTDVVKILNGAARLCSGGFYTTTTKTRMNQTSNVFGLGYQVYQRNFYWWVSYQGEEWPFEDGMICHPRLGVLYNGQAERILESHNQAC